MEPVDWCMSSARKINKPLQLATSLPQQRGIAQTRIAEVRLKRSIEQRATREKLERVAEFATSLTGERQLDRVGVADCGAKPELLVSGEPSIERGGIFRGWLMRGVPVRAGENRLPECERDEIEARNALVEGGKN